MKIRFKPPKTRLQAYRATMMPTYKELNAFQKEVLQSPYDYCSLLEESHEPLQMEDTRSQGNSLFSIPDKFEL